MFHENRKRQKKKKKKAQTDQKGRNAQTKKRYLIIIFT